ncbi:MAG: ABC transporter substrate-binding protein [Pseudomonadota bacterium]
MPTYSNVSRRGVLAGAAAIVAVGSGGIAHAISEDVAKAHIQQTVNDLLALLRMTGDAGQMATTLRGIMESRSNLPLLAKYCAGRNWRDMNDDQRSRYTEAFTHYISVTYARRFAEYSGEPKIEVGKAIDAGRKGMLVQSPLTLPDGRIIMVEWLVSDRSGTVEVVDIVLEGVSLAATQREEIGAMFDRRNGDADALIQHLASA